jgi:hypothetical protein
MTRKEIETDNAPEAHKPLGKAEAPEQPQTAEPLNRNHNPRVESPSSGIMGTKMGR